MSGLTPSASQSTSSSDAGQNTPRVEGQASTDTPQTSLQHASAALEAAYNRIRQIRQSLLQLSESLPDSGTHPRFPLDLNELGLGHEALPLTDNNLEDQVDLGDYSERTSPSILRSNVPPNSGMQPRVGGAEDSRMQPPEFYHIPILPPFTRRENTDDLPLGEFRAAGYNGSSAATTRGLRVAAREASNRASATHLQAVQGEGSTGDVFGGGDYDRFLGRPRRTDANSPASLMNEVSPAERQPRPYRNMDLRDTRRTLPLPSSLAANVSSTSWRAPDYRRWRSLRQEPRQATRPLAYDISETSQPTISPDSLPLNSARNPHTMRAFEQRQQTRFSNVSEQYRLYQEALREDHPGARRVGRWDDISSNSNIDWSDEDFVSWLFPAQDEYLHQYQDFAAAPPRHPDQNQQRDDAIRVTRTTNTAISPAENLLPRRGWARLDADGNEIPPNEEEELERSRTEYRVRALQRSRELTATTHPSRMPPYVQGPSGHHPPRNTYGSVMDSTLNVQYLRQPASLPQPQPQHQHQTFTPLYVDPLPMPLASMVMTPKKMEQEDLYVDIFVPGYACLAGR
ncbi:hypothetical protein B0H34DRAFT_683273 [Crassisporium funariophilum]|nr:hypothetical protein B0H34DRAFT_683273 [Crassisporium funariophilum]